MEVVKLLQVLQGNLVLLAPGPHVDPLQGLDGRGLEVDDQVHVQLDIAVGVGEELEPLIQDLVLTAQHLLTNQRRVLKQLTNQRRV